MVCPGGYDPIAEKVFSQLDVDAFLLEYESERAGTFEPLRFVPRGKTVVLGLVSSKLATDRAAGSGGEADRRGHQYVPLENLALSPQCGFASTMDGNLLTEDEQWSKLGWCRQRRGRYGEIRKAAVAAPRHLRGCGVRAEGVGADPLKSTFTNMSRFRGTSTASKLI